MQTSFESAFSSLDPRTALLVAGSLLLLLGLGLLAYVPLARALLRRVLPASGAPVAGWGFPHVVLAAVAVFVLLALSGLVVPRPATGSADRLLLDGLARMACALAAGAVLVVLLARRTSPDGVRALGITARGNARPIAVALAGYLPLLPGFLALGLAWTLVLVACGVEIEGQEVARGFLGMRKGYLPPAFALAVVVLPFFEELFFRAFLQPVLVGKLGAYAGVVATSFLFAALHGLQPFLPIFGLSLFLGAVMLRTGRLAASYVVHALHNGTMLAFVLVANSVTAG
jgi:membrane protease YdiL (CAAX protease family)